MRNSERGTRNEMTNRLLTTDKGPMTDLRFAFRQLLKNPGFTAMAVLVLAFAVPSGSARAAENDGAVWWPQFRGPNSSGVGDGRPPVHFGPGQNVLWKAATGSGISSPILWGDRVF